MKRLSMKDQEKLLLAVGGLLANAEDPKHVKTATAMCGKGDLVNVWKVWRRCFNLSRKTK